MHDSKNESPGLHSRGDFNLELPHSQLSIHTHIHQGLMTAKDHGLSCRGSTD